MSVGSRARDRAVAHMHQHVDRVMRAIVLEALGRIIQKTPVDTGRARANWNTTVDTPNTGLRGIFSNSPSEPIQLGRPVIAAAQFATGQHVFIANGLPYIEMLEAGSSKQAANGMIAVTIEELRPLVDRLTKVDDG